MNQKAQDGDEQQQQREQRQETVVSDQCGQIEPLVVAELVDHGKREAKPTVAPLVAVERAYDAA